MLLNTLFWIFTFGFIVGIDRLLFGGGNWGYCFFLFFTIVCHQIIISIFMPDYYKNLARKYERRDKADTK